MLPYFESDEDFDVLFVKEVTAFDEAVGLVALPIRVELEKLLFERREDNCVEFVLEFELELELEVSVVWFGKITDLVRLSEEELDQVT